MIKLVTMILIGFFLLVKGADVLVSGSAGIAKRFGISEIIIGLTIVSIGTSMPELCISVVSAIHGSSDISMGNVIGSCLCNLLLILGLTAMIHDVKIRNTTRLIEIPFLIIITFILYVVSQSGELSRVNGFLLMLLFLCFIVYTIFFAQRESARSKALNEAKDENAKKPSIIKSAFCIIIGVIALKYGGDYVVDNATEVAKILGISDKVIGSTIIAIGTSLPELVTSIIAAYRGETDMAIGNIIGSNIFNLLLVVGVSCIIKPLQYNYTYNHDLLFLFGATIILMVVPMVGKKDYMSKGGGALFVITYISYMIYLILT